MGFFFFRFFFFYVNYFVSQKVETGERSLLVTESLVLISQRSLPGLDLLHKIRGSIVRPAR